MDAQELSGSNFYKYYTSKTTLDADDFAKLLPYFEFRVLNHNQLIMRSGEVCKHFLFVEKGIIQSFSLDSKGGEHILQFAPENWLMVDRASIYFGEPSSYYIKAIEPSVVVFMQPQFLVEAAKLKPDVASFTEVSLQRNIFFIQRRVNSLIAYTARERYLEFMELYPDLLLRVPQWMIASYLGITPESLSRVRREIAKESF